MNIKIKYLHRYYFRKKAQYIIVKFPLESIKHELDFFEKYLKYE